MKKIANFFYGISEMSGDDCKPAAKRSESFIDESGRQNKYNKKNQYKKRKTKHTKNKKTYATLFFYTMK